MKRKDSPVQNQLTAWLLRRTPSAGVRRVAGLGAAIASEVGNVRDENQDRAVIGRGIDNKGQEYAVVAVADGIGGMADGAACAALAIGSFLATIEQQARSGDEPGEKWMHSAVVAANQAVFDNYHGNGGSTLVAVLFRRENAAYWLSVGDSRVYSANGKHLVQLSTDDTIAGQLGNNSDGAPEQSKLLQFIGMGDELEPHIAEFPSNNASRAVILTTDGVHYLSPMPGLLGQIVANSPDPGMCVKRLVDLAKWCGGPDNATVAFIDLSVGIEWECRPPYQCLEVWDAFGELQIVVPDCIAVLQEESSTTVPETSSAETASIKKVDKKERHSSKRNRSKRDRSEKPSNNEQKKEELEREVPQLRMEFPKKPD